MNTQPARSKRGVSHSSLGVSDGELRERISKAMGWWSPDGFDAYPEKTDKVLALYAELVDKVIGVDEGVKDVETLESQQDYYDNNLTPNIRNELRDEQRQRLDKLMSGEEKEV